MVDRLTKVNWMYPNSFKMVVSPYFGYVKTGVRSPCRKRMAALFSSPSPKVSEQAITKATITECILKPLNSTSIA